MVIKMAPDQSSAQKHVFHHNVSLKQTSNIGTLYCKQCHEGTVTHQYFSVHSVDERERGSQAEHVDFFPYLVMHREKRHLRIILKSTLMYLLTYTSYKII